jgi:anti-sigma factor ChrR (cupin superfamily)
VSNERLVKFDVSDPARLRHELDWVQHGSQGRQGARIRPVYRLHDPARSLAFVRFEPGSRAPPHRHASFETIVVLEGAYTDDFGTHRQGEVVVYPPGSRHAWASVDGATLLVVWDGPTLTDDEP